MNSEFSETLLNSNVKVSHRRVGWVVALKQYLSLRDVISLLVSSLWTARLSQEFTSRQWIPMRAPDVPSMLLVDRGWAK